MKVAYLIQTHKNPEQIYRLIRTLIQGSPQCRIVVSHDNSQCQLDEALVGSLGNVSVLYNRAHRGDFSLVQGYLDALRWLIRGNVAFDWIVNLSGQDYPAQPLPRIEAFLAETKFEGFMHHFDAFSNSPSNAWGARQGRDRYLYHYRVLTRGLTRWEWRLSRLPAQAVNRIQRFIRLNTSADLLLGIRASAPPFNSHFVCYGGPYFMTLSRRCAEYIDHFIQQRPDVVDYYKRTFNPDESFLHTVLANSGRFRFCNDSKRFIDWTVDFAGHPRILTVADLPRITGGEFHFARKFDIERDGKVLDLLDESILK